MKKIIAVFVITIMSLFGYQTVREELSGAQVTNNVQGNSIDFSKIVDSSTLDADFVIASAGFTFTITDAQVDIGNARFTSDTNRLGINTTTPQTVFEVQGTASASYFLTGNTLQVGGFASLAYSRFGIAATTHAGTISGKSDLLVVGGFEVNGSAAFDGLIGLFSAATSSFEIQSTSGTQGACLALKDADGTGYTYCRALNGVLTCTTVSCK